MKPQVVNVRDFLFSKDPPFIYVGRAMPSFKLKAHPLANPFRMTSRAAKDESARQFCLDLYREWLDALPDRDELLRELAAQVKATGLPLGCWCAPKSCHADILAELIEPLIAPVFTNCNVCDSYDRTARCRIAELENAIKTHRSQKADDRCIEDDDRLYEALGDRIKCDRRVGDKEAMKHNCARFIDNRCEGGGWPTYVELEAENAHLRAALAMSKDPCLYCQLSKDDMAKCKSGFPGCARADDMMGCPEFGASLNAMQLEAEVNRLKRLNEDLAERVAKQSELLSKRAEKTVP